MDQNNAPDVYHQRLDELDARIRQARAGCPAAHVQEGDALETRAAAFRGRLSEAPADASLHSDWEALKHSVENWIVNVGREDGMR